MCDGIAHIGPRLRMFESVLDLVYEIVVARADKDVIEDSHFRDVGRDDRQARGQILADLERVSSQRQLIDGEWVNCALNFK